MSDKKKEKLKAGLVKAGLMEEDDVILEYLQANYLDRLIGKVGQWKQGWVYFTERKFICPTGILNQDIVIPYDSIKEIGKCSQGLIPIGITITYEEPEGGRLVTDKFSMMKRDKWIAFLSEKAGI